MITFEVFQATKKPTEDLGETLKDGAPGYDGIPGLVYLNSLFLVTRNPNWEDSPAWALGHQYELTIGNESETGNDLEAFERRLYEFARTAGYLDTTITEGADKIAAAFRQMFDAAMVINEVLLGVDVLNDSVPQRWPLMMSADEWAHECLAMVAHYEDVSKTGEADPTAGRLAELEKLAADARCVTEDDWGTERQIDAENKFFEAVEAMVSRDLYQRLEGYCLKATTDEMIDMGLKVARGEEKLERYRTKFDGRA